MGIAVPAFRMPAQRARPSLAPHSLEQLYSKYGPDKLHPSLSPSSVPTTTTTKPSPSSSPLVQNVKKRRHRRPPPPVVPGRELGDLTKLGSGLSKLERVHLLLNIDPAGRKSHLKNQNQVSLSAENTSRPEAVCSECSQVHKSTDKPSKLKDMKSKLRLLAPRILPDKGPPVIGTSPVRHPAQNVVPLPLLHIQFQRQNSGSGALAAVQDTRQTLRRMFFPQNFKSRSSAAAWNLKTFGGSLPARSQERMESTDASSRFLTSDGMPPSSGLAGRYNTESISTFDADRVDSEQFEYVFDRFSSLSTDSDFCTTETPESDTATFSARAQRPSTTDTLVTHYRLTRSWSSRARPLSPISAKYKGAISRESPALSPMTPHHRARASRESWSPTFTVIPSWPALDDPFRFQYLGRGVHRDIMRRLHRSRGGKKHGKHGKDSDMGQPPAQPNALVPQLPQKLEVVVPTHPECHLCKTLECEHTTPRQVYTTARSSRPPSLSALSGVGSEGRSDSNDCQPVKAPVTGDPDNAWCVDKRCSTQGNEGTFDRSYYTRQDKTRQNSLFTRIIDKH